MNTSRDDAVLLLCEELENAIYNHKKHSHDVNLDEADQPLNKRFRILLDKIETERRLIEDVSLPCRFVVEHLSLFIDEMEYTIGFEYRDVRSGRGLLHSVRIGEWGAVTVHIGDVQITWRDPEVSYMFYPDKIIIRQKTSAVDDITFYFSYPFKYALSLLQAFQEVSKHEKTLYWHESLISNN